jgi:hypothetical protein
MKLFIIDENNEVVVNQPWVKLIPEFKAIFTYFRSKSNSGSQSYAKANKVLAYIYFMVDFSSPLKTWNEDDRKVEAMRYTSLTADDVKLKVVQDALDYYYSLLIANCRPLKTYHSLLKTAEAMDKYFETLNFDSVDKQGKLKYTPNQAVDNAGKMNKFYDELYKLETRVTTELEQNSGIRGKSTFGDKELQYASDKLKGKEARWDETTGDIPEGPQMKDISELLKPKED